MKCILFGRVSTEVQDLTSQINDLTAEATRLGYAHANIINIMKKESAVKLSNDEREGVAELKQVIEENPDVNCVIIHEISRLARRPKDMYEIRDWLLEKRIQVICLKPYFRMMDEMTGRVSESANLLLGIYASIIENEGFIRKERLKRGKNQARKNGKFLGGHVRFGFALDHEKRIIADEKGGTAELVRSMFRMYADGYNISYIREFLNKNGVKKRNETIINMISCDKYIDLIGEDLWQKVQEVKKSKTLVGKERSWSFGEKLLKCPKCGRTMKIWSKNYKCYGRAYNYTDDGCDCTVTITRKRLDSILFNCSLGCHNIIIINGSEERKDEIEKELQEIPKLMEITLKELDKLSKKMERVADNYIAGIINKDKMLKNRDKLFAEKVKLEMQKQKYEADEKLLKNEIKSIESDLLFSKCVSQEEWFALGKEKIYEYVHKYIERVELTGEGENKTVIVYPYKWVNKKPFKFFLSGRGRTYKIIEEIDGVQYDWSADKWHLIDFGKV